jgi:hypothetical protein
MYELFAVIFDNIDLNNLEMFLIEKCGFLLKDVEHVMRISKIIREISDESDTQLEKIITKVDRSRVVNMCRLLKAMNYKLLVKNLRKQKNRILFKTELCINESVLRLSFGIDDQHELAKLLEIAKAKVAENSEFNDKTKILLYLNSERTKKCLDQDQNI